MAMRCIKGGECSGCMRCENGEPLYVCPSCDAMIGPFATVYSSAGQVLGCDECIDADAAEYALREYESV